MYRLIIILGLILAVYFLAKRALFPPRKRTIDRKEGSEEMVQDPVCKCYIAKNQSYSLSFKGDRLFFCSEECFKKYLASHALPKP